MAQGPPKKPTSTRPSSAAKRSHDASRVKKGARTVAPKKKKLIDQKKLTKKYSAGLIKKTERNLAEKAGHLEMLNGGKKTKKDTLGKSSKGKER